ncbi:MAG: MFS transporter [Acidobacteria bacterium]|nr:MAG: MFS transporter [Acidobacteriota bacterium]
MIVALLNKLVDIKQEEKKSCFYSFCYFFCILSSYYILRPLREEMGVAGGVANLPLLYLGTLTGMLLATPIFGALVTRYSRKVFIPVVYHFFAFNLITFYILSLTLQPESHIWLGRVFYVWVSVFNLFVVTVFWGFMADIFSLERAKRLFGFIAMGGSLGGLVGAGITAFLVEHLGRIHLILISFLLLELAVFFIRLINKNESMKEVGLPTTDEKEELTLKDIFNGVHLLLKSRYLLGISLYLFLYSFTSTAFYFQQAYIVDSNIPDRIARAAFFGRIDFAVNSLTVLIQLFLTSKIIRWLGIGKTLVILPIITIAGFSWLSLSATPLVIAIIQVMRRTTNFALIRPANEALFTVLTPEEKYKAKSFLDTFIYRGGDAIVAGIFGILRNLGASLTLIAIGAAPIGILWGATGIWLGRRIKQPQKECDTSHQQVKK